MVNTMVNQLFSLIAQATGGQEKTEQAGADKSAGAEVPLGSTPADSAGGPTAPAPSDPYEYSYGDYWFPERASDFAAEVDWLFYFIFWVCVIFFAIIVAVMVGFVIKYRKRPGHMAPLPSPSHNTKLEILWSVLPSFLLVFMFVAGASGYFKQRIVPEGAYETHIEASQFNWQFTTERGDITEDLHMVVNEPFKLTMESRDVLHSWFVPAFRQKMDVVPGRYSEVWVKPTKIGIFRLYCAEYCGDGHSLMKRNVIVHESWDDFNKATIWKDEEHTPEENGQRLYKINCAGCHSIDGSVKTGPSFLGKYGSDEPLTTGAMQTVDDNYIISSILEPQKDIVEGYGPRSQMPTFKGKLSPKQIRYIIAYMKTLK